MDEEVEGDDAQQGERTVSLEALYVYAVQTKAIQQLCFKFPPPEVAPEGNGSTPADARGVQLLSPMALLAADDQVCAFLQPCCLNSLQCRGWAAECLCCS